jgi:DNA-binding GntR family transcriptional regulator
MDIYRKDSSAPDASHEIRFYTLIDSPKYKQHLAYDYLKESIISGKFPPNKPLIERELCDTLGVSRTPVREALRRLSSDGFVDFVPGRGTVVTRLTMDDMVHVYELKEALDKMAVKLCIQRKTDELM